MRQILIGAWLVLASSVVACSGEEFAAGSGNDDQTTGSFSSDDKSGSNAGRNSGGSTSSGGSGNPSGGKSTAGSSNVVPPGVGGSGVGGSASGGASSSGGSVPGVDEPECAEGKVTFKMVPGPDLTHDYLCDASCGTGWLTITDAEGASALSIFPACAAVSCESCEALPCAAAACLPTPLTAEGTQVTWSGLSLVADSCGAGTACQRQSCVPSGKYKAKACANVNAGQNGMSGGCMPKDGVMLCTEAEFELPGTSEVVLVLEKP